MRRSDRILAAVVVTCAFWSVGAFLAHVYGLLRMPFTISAISLPASLVIVGIAAWAGRTRRLALLRRLWVGLIAGLAAVAVYDLLRGAIWVASGTDFNPFRAHPNFGALILSTSPSTAAAVAAGWAYHIWNGVSFAIMYAVLAGGARMVYALAWAMALETATVVVYPRAFPVSRTDAAFLVVSFLGHAAYGLTLGVLTRNWLGPRSKRAAVFELPRPSVKEGLR